MGKALPIAPGLAWLEILQRPTLVAFASAFTHDDVLEASVLREPARGVAAIRKVFDATHIMYERIAFLHETRSGCRACLEGQGHVEGQGVAGVTILAHDAQGLIESAALYHRPYNQVVSFTAEPARRLAETIGE